MLQKLEIEEFLEKSKTFPIIDVRSPGEFEYGHIPSAKNINLFTNEERAIVGTKYKNAGKDAAVLVGLEFVGPKLATFVGKTKKIAIENEVLVHCARGGMRSGSFAWLLDTAGFKVSTLVGGYKSYRNHVLAAFLKPLKIIILGGKTGSGKTETLHELEKLGEQVLDLEGLAHHKGSSYGALGQNPQPSSEHFENLIFEKLQTFDLSKRIWVEDESKNVGTCNIPNELWNQMRFSPVAFMEISKEERIKRLVREYACFTKTELQEATDRIKKRLGGDMHKAATEALLAEYYAKVADITLTYYDKSYLFGLSKRENQNIQVLDYQQDTPKKNAEKLILSFENLFNL